MPAQLERKRTIEMNSKKCSIIATDYNSPFVRNFIWVDSFPIQAKQFGIPRAQMAIFSRDDDIEYLVEGQSWAAAHEAIRQKTDSDKNFINKIIDETNRIGEAFNEWSDKHIQQADLRNESNAKLIELLSKFSQKQSEMYAYGIIMPLIDFQNFSFVEGNLKRILNEKLPSGEFAKYYDALTMPSHNSFAQDQEQDLLRLMAKFDSPELRKQVASKPNLQELAKEFPEFCRGLETHAQKHGWVYYVYAGPVFKAQQFYEFVREHIANGINPTKRLAEIEKQKTEVAKQKEKLIASLKPDEFEEMILRLAGKLVWAKPRRKDYQSKSYWHLEKLLREIARRCGASLSQVRSTPFDKLAQALQTGKFDENLANEVQKVHIVIPDDNGNSQLLYGKQAEKYYDENVEPHAGESATGSQVQGATACPGKAKGHAKIINKPSQMAKMQKGDILISTATTPAIVPAMKKAAAIVTDEGGLTCHAAIVSRELGIPCIVGTRVATRIFKDGEEVEVDAAKGIARKV